MKHNIINDVLGNCATLSIENIFIMSWKMATFLPKMFPIFSFANGEKIKPGLFTDCDYTVKVPLKGSLFKSTFNSSLCNQQK